MKNIKRLHTVGKEANQQQEVCGECFVWVEYEDSYCWNCGAGFEENSAYDIDDLKTKKVLG